MLGKIVSPRLEKLEKEFLESGGEWKNFPICKLFRKVKTKALPYKARDLKNKYDEVYSLPALTAGLENQGLAYYVPRDNATILKNVISVSANGANTGVMFYQPNEFTVLQDSYAIEYKDKILNSKGYLFILSALQKTIRFRFDWSNKAGWEKIKNEEITLPFLNGNIDFDFIETYISELEEERISELESYLTVSGLDNYELSSEEEEALEKFDLVQWEEYKVGDLFEKLNLKFKKSKFDKINDISKVRTSEFNIPLVNAKFGDNGIMYYGRKNDFETASMTIDIVNDGAISTGSVYPQPQETGVLYNAYLIKPLFDVNNHILYFLSTSIQKSIKEKFGYENKAAWEKVKKEFIQLPTNNNEIDFSCMELLISAVQKLVIKDVVLYADNKIQATKKVINSKNQNS